MADIWGRGVREAFLKRDLLTDEWGVGSLTHVIWPHGPGVK